MVDFRFLLVGLYYQLNGFMQIYVTFKTLLINYRKSITSFLCTVDWPTVSFPALYNSEICAKYELSHAVALPGFGARRGTKRASWQGGWAPRP